MANLVDTSVNGDLRVTGTMFGTQAGNYATCATAAGTAAKAVTISGFTLTTGIHVFVKFTVTNTAAVASLTLNVSGTGAKAMKYRGGNLPAVGTLSASRVYEFIYDGTNWELVGDLDTNTQTVTGVKGNAESSYRTGQVNLTAANIGASASDHTHGNIGNGGTLTDTAAAAAGNDYVVIRDADNNKVQTSTIKGTDVADAVSKKHSHSTLTLSTTAQAYDGTHTLALPSSDPYTSARTPTSHTHGNIANGGTLTDTAAAAAGNDYVVIRDADNAKIQTSTIKGTDVADAVSKKHSHSTLTLSTTAQAYDGSHTLALPSSDPYTSARTPSSHASSATTYGVGTTANYGHVKLDNSTPLGVTDSNADGVATGKGHKHNNIESVARASVTTVDLDHVNTNNRAHMILSQVSSSTGTTHDPGDGYMLTFMWDTNDPYDAQLYIPVDSTRDWGRIKIRYRDNNSSGWGDWGYIRLAATSSILYSSNNLDNVKGSAAGQILSYNWATNSVPTNAPVSTATSMMLVYQPHASYCYQAVITAQDGIYRRICKNGTWTAWTKDLDAADITTGSANGTISVAGSDITVYTHPTTAGNKHIPSGGSSGQFLGWDSAGTAKWVNNPNSDTKVKATAKTDNVNYKVLATASASPTSGNATEAVYDTDISLNPSTNTITANISGNAATATSLGVNGISYHRPTSSTGSTADGKQWCRLGTLTDTAVTEGAQWFGIGVLFNVYSNPYGPVRTHFGCYEFSFRIGISARAEGAAAYSLKTSGDMTIQKLYGPDVPATADGRSGIDFRIVRSDTKVELFIKNSVWDSAIYVERFRQISNVGSYGTWEWAPANGLYTDDEFTTYCSDKTVKYLTKRYEFRSNLADSTTWNNCYNSYKEVTFGSSITYETFCAACTTADSFAYKTFGDTLDTTEKTINAIGRLNLSYNSAIQTGIGLTDGYPMFHVVATRQAGYMDISSGSTIVRYKFSRYGALSNKVTISTGDTKVTQTADNSSTGTGFEVLFSATADNTTRTEASCKSSKLTFQPSTGTLTATKFSGPLTGNVTGNCSGSSGSCTGNSATATSAGKLTTARKAYVTLGTASTTTTVDWSADPTTIPVDGTLAVSHGGTGMTTVTNVNSVVIGNSSSATGAMQTVAAANGAFYSTGANVKPQFGTLPAAQGGTGKTSAKDACNAFINALDTGSSTPVDADYYVSQYVSGGTTTTTYHRRPMSALWTYIKGKMTSDTGVNISGNAATATSATSASSASKVANKLTLKIKTGTTEGTDLYTYDGSGAKTLDIKQGSNITLTAAAGSLTIAGTADTKNTAGSTDTSSKIFLIGATSQAANPQTYSQDTTYVDTDATLASTKFRVAETCTLQYNSTDQALDFVF